MRIVLLTRTSRPSGAAVAKSLFEHTKDIVAIVAEERSQLLKKRGGSFAVVSDSVKDHGLRFTAGRALELCSIKLHFLSRKILGNTIFRSKEYFSVEEFALHRKTPYFVVKDHNSRESEELIRSFTPDMIVITNTRLIRSNILSLPRYGCLNLHSSLLPEYAGLDSIFWAMFYGEKEIGVTVHYASAEIDRGDIVLQKRIAVEANDNDNDKSLYRKTMKQGAQLMAEAITLIEENKARPIQQDLRRASYFGWPSKEQRSLLRKKLKNRRKRKSQGPIRVLHIITRLVKGGAQENTLLTVLGLRDKGYKVVLASGPSIGPEGEIESYARKMGVDLAIIPELTRDPHLWKDLISLVKIYVYIRKNRFDIVHTHTSKAGIIGRLAAKLAGVPVVVHTPHGHIFHSYFGPLKTKVFHNLEVIFAGFCDKIITLTDQCKNEHISVGVASREKFITIHSGVNFERFTNRSFDNNAVRARLRIPGHKKVVGTVARLELVKGVSFFVEAMPQVLRSFPDAHFLIVGDGSQRKDLEAQAKNSGIDGNITFTGLRDDVPELLSCMDVFVLSSLNEGMGRVLVEAGIMAKPVVATRVSGIPELVVDRETGILVEPRNPLALAAGINEILSDGAKAKTMGENARIRMAENFSARKMVDKIDTLYKELL